MPSTPPSETRPRRGAAAIGRLALALRRCAPFALSIFVTYFASSCVGIFMAHGGSALALEQRDRIVAKALATDPASIAFATGDRALAVAHDFAANLLVGALPQAIGGLAVVPPYLSVAYQGWIGGIVSVDGRHRSRFEDPRKGAYYVLVLLLQFVPYSLLIGAGVRLGVELYRENAAVGWRLRGYRFPRAALVDAACVAGIAVPLFLGASAFEFLSPWNG
jgi:hypothetical protein